MDKKFIKYSVFDFTQDLDFINWVQKGTNKKNWESFVIENPSLSDDIKTATEIVSAFKFKANDFQNVDVYESYKNIETLYNRQAIRKRRLKFGSVLKYAALFLFVFSLGATISYFYFTRNIHQFTEIPVSTSDFNQAKLILSDGEEIVLKEKQTELQFNAAGTEVKIDKDSTINTRRETSPGAMAQVVVPYGNRSNITLSDGTKVWLNAGSKFIFPQKFTGSNRRVFLKGEAYFDVFKNKDIPFIVTTDKMNVTVQGTEFNMRDNDTDNEMEVILVEGSVSLKDNSVMNLLGKEIRLVPNQKAIYNKAENKTVVESNVDVTYYISWKEGLLEFNRESILSVFNRLSRYYNVRFATESNVELNWKISGKLDLKESLGDVLKVVADAAPVTFRIDNDKVYVIKKVNYLPMR